MKDMDKIQLSRSVYVPLFEEPEKHSGWDKATVKYALNCKTKIMQVIYKYAKSMNKVIQKTDVDDCYEELLLYLHNTNDYDVAIACERGKIEKGGLISLDNYVFSMLKYIVIRHVTDKIKKEVKEVRVINDSEEGDELDLFNVIAVDDESELDDLFYDLDNICRTQESNRYKYKVDIFELWFIKLLSIKYNKQEVYSDILSILDINSIDINNLKRKTNYGGVMLDIAKAISVCGIDNAIAIIRRYVYSADKIERVVQLYS